MMTTWNITKFIICYSKPNYTVRFGLGARNNFKPTSYQKLLVTFSHVLSAENDIDIIWKFFECKHFFTTPWIIELYGN